jgi:PmbA protein
LEEILKAALKVADAADLFWVESRSTPVAFESNRLKHLQTKESRGVGLRIIKGGRIGFSATNRMEDVDGIVRRALEVSPYGARAEFSLPSAAEHPQVPTYDPEVPQVSIEKMVELSQAMVDGVLAGHPDVLCDAGVSQSVVKVRILNSNGLDASYEKTVFSLGLGGTLVRGTDMLFVGDGESSCRPITDASEIVARVTGQLDQAHDMAEVTTGSFPVVFTPDAVAGLLLSPLLVGFNGKTVLQGSSPLVGRLGEKIVDERFSLYDDGTIAYRPGSRPWDDEGIPTRITPIIENGVARNFIYDLKTAAQAGAESTGNASRGAGSLPSPSMSVISIAEGDMSFEDMVADMKEGLVVERFLGAGQTNILAGDFSGNVLLGYKVENGRMVGRVKNSMLSGNVFETLNNLIAIGSQARWRGGSLRTPHLYCSNVSVARTEG